MTRIGSIADPLQWAQVNNQSYIANAQQRMAQEQWDWQKRIYGEQQASAKAGANSLSALVNQYNQAYNSARSANEQRYQQLLGIADQTTGQRMADIRSTGAGQSADIMQQLARTGMANTTVAPTLQMGVNRETQSSLNRAADELQGTKLGIIERREDEYPDSNIIVQLAQALGQSGGSGMSGILKALSGLKLGGAAA
jgi:hypothetical protein